LLHEHAKEIHVFLSEMNQSEVDDFDSLNVPDLVDKNRVLMMELVETNKNFKKFNINQ